MKNPKYLRNSPFYRLFASDLIANFNYRFMDIDERGLLFSMLNEYWISDSLPSDINQLSKILGFDVEKVKKAKTNNVMAFFTEDNEKIKSKELAIYKEQLREQRILMSNGGIKGQLIKQYNAKQISEDDFKGRLEDTLKVTDMIRNDVKRPEINKSGLNKLKLEPEEYRKKIKESFIKGGVNYKFKENG